MIALLLALIPMGPEEAAMQQKPAIQQSVAAETWIVDQVFFPMPADMTKLEPALVDAHSMDEVVAVLEKFGIEHRRESGKLDTRALGPEIVRRVNELPPEEPWIIPIGDGSQLVANHVVERQAVDR